MVDLFPQDDYADAYEPSSSFLIKEKPMFFTIRNHRKPWSPHFFISGLLILNMGCRISAQPAVGTNATRLLSEDYSYDTSIPSPSDFLGYPLGSKAATYGEVAAYTAALAQASPYVIRRSYGISHEGRELTYLTITHPNNHEHLEELQQEHARLADPRRLTNTSERGSLIEKLPAVAWFNYSIHGDELSSTDAALFVAYHLAAGRNAEIQQLLKYTIIHMVPLVNPDGRERFLGQIRQFTGVTTNPDVQAMHHAALWTRGRGNHYLFDLNRDWLILEQPEVRDLATLFKDWHPQLLVDSHEMGPDDTYLFDPPNIPHNLHLAESTMRWRRAFGADQARAFDRYGWSYYTRDWYTDWAPIYTNAWASLRDAAGLLYEQARANSSQIKQPNGIVMTYRDTVRHQAVSCLANLRFLHKNRKTILTDFANTRTAAISTEAEMGKFFLLPPHADTDRWQRLINLLQRQGVEVQIAKEEMDATQVTDLYGKFDNTRRFASGTAVVSINQPLRNLLLTLLGFDPHLTDDFLHKERKELEKHRRTRMYDTSTWNLPMASGLPAYWAQEIPKGILDSLAESQQTTIDTLANSQYGYLIDGRRWDTTRLLINLFQQDCRVRIATKSFRTGDRDYQPGTLLLRKHENQDNLQTILDKAGQTLHIEVTPINSAWVQEGDDLGGRRFRLLVAPRTAICSRWPVSTTSFGSLWYLLDHKAGLQCSPVSGQALGSLDLRMYNVLILPEISGAERLLDNGVRDKLKQWVQAGGTLIATGNSAAFLANQARGLSQVRLKRDVLEELMVYDEALMRERAARDIQIDPATVWAYRPNAEPNVTSAQKEKHPGDKETRQRLDEWRRIFSPSGVFLAGELDTEHWLCAGLEKSMPIFFRGRNVFMAKHPVQSPVRLTSTENLRLSGLLWPEARTRIADSAYATVERMGRGQVILFATDPSYRMWFPGMQRLLLNAVLLGPGMGTSPPRPW